jgi:hypothetical protein
MTIDNGDRFPCLEDELDAVYERHFDSIIDNLHYFQQLMANPDLAKYLRKKFGKKIGVLEYFGIQFTDK